VRLPAVVLGTAVLGLIYILAARLYGPRTGFWAMLLTAATPGSAALSLLMTIDAPLLFCWCAALYSFWRVLDSASSNRDPTGSARAVSALPVGSRLNDGGRGLWWVLATLATGLGLLCKQTMLGFIPLAGLFLLASPTDRRELRRPGFWLWACGSLLFLTPVLWWNYRHGWITAEHTSGHFAAEPVAFLKRLSRFGEFVGAQFGVGSPITCALFVAVTAFSLRSFRCLDRREKFLICFSGVPMLGVLCLAFKQRVEPNWPAAFCPAGVVLVAGWGLGKIRGIRPLKNGTLVLRRAIAVGAVFVLVTYLLPYGFGLQGSKLDPAVRLRGWQALGRAMGQRLAEVPRPERTFIVVAEGGRATASEMAFYMPSRPEVCVWNESGRIVSQYDVWGLPQGREGWDAMIVTAPACEPPGGLTAAFDRVESAGDVNVPFGHGRQHYYAIWRGIGFRQWPAEARTAGRGTSGSHTLR
jgi:undecaprenyl-diphosphatase